jgi:hypothetical protein
MKHGITLLQVFPGTPDVLTHKRRLQKDGALTLSLHILLHHHSIRPGRDCCPGEDAHARPFCDRDRRMTGLALSSNREGRGRHAGKVTRMDRVSVHSAVVLGWDRDRADHTFSQHPTRRLTDPQTLSGYRTFVTDNLDHLCLGVSELPHASGRTLPCSKDLGTENEPTSWHEFSVGDLAKAKSPKLNRI